MTPQPEKKNPGAGGDYGARRRDSIARSASSRSAGSLPGSQPSTAMYTAASLADRFSRAEMASAASAIRSSRAQLAAAAAPVVESSRFASATTAAASADDC